MNKEWGDVQVLKDHYLSTSYLSKARFLGLFGQVNSLLNQKASGNILEIGPGPGLFSAIMEKLGTDVTTIDFDVNIRVDIIARLPEIPIKSGAFESVCAFEVLEHVPFGLFNRCLSEMARVSNSLVIISVPNIRRLNPQLQISLDLRIKGWKYRKELLMSGQNKLTNPQEHFWELGVNGIQEEMIVDEGEKIGLQILRNEFVEPWFQFFIFKKRSRIQ